MKDSTKKIILFSVIGAFLLAVLDFIIVGDRIGKMPAYTVAEDLTLNERIVAKISGYDIKTEAEVQKKIESDKKQKITDDYNKKVNDRDKKIDKLISEGKFTQEEYDKFINSIIDKLTNDEITIDECDDLQQKLADEKINIYDYIK